ncbi:uncharacterized protein [Maniola hyperantus]|uniref:uncharacterized protein n=1 Tax=Aphantopus hyperantus TaxID=2795564 RepID=UPI003748C633
MKSVFVFFAIILTFFALTTSTSGLPAEERQSSLYQSYFEHNIIIIIIINKLFYYYCSKMKGFLLIFAVMMALFSLTSAMFVEPEDPILERAKREDCDYRECDQFCRRLGLPGGACIKNKCDCDRF